MLLSVSISELLLCLKKNTQKTWTPTGIENQNIYISCKKLRPADQWWNFISSSFALPSLFSFLWLIPYFHLSKDKQAFWWATKVAVFHYTLHLLWLTNKPPCRIRCYVCGCILLVWQCTSSVTVKPMCHACFLGLWPKKPWREQAPSIYRYSITQALDSHGPCTAENIAQWWNTTSDQWVLSLAPNRWVAQDLVYFRPHQVCCPVPSKLFPL